MRRTLAGEKPRHPDCVFGAQRHGTQRALGCFVVFAVICSVVICSVWTSQLVQGVLVEMNCGPRPITIVTISR